MTKYTKPNYSEQCASAGITLYTDSLFGYRYQTKILIHKEPNILE